MPALRSYLSSGKQMKHLHLSTVRHALRNMSNSKVDENGPGGAVLVYDLGNIISGFYVERDDVSNVINIRNLKSTVMMGDEVKRMLKAADTGVGAYDLKGDFLQFIK
jgi:hypothetical protein